VDVTLTVEFFTIVLSWTLSRGVTTTAALPLLSGGGEALPFLSGGGEALP
jgi:hypothetical protein